MVAVVVVGGTIGLLLLLDAMLKSLVVSFGGAIITIEDFGVNDGRSMKRWISKPIVLVRIVVEQKIESRLC